MFSGSGVLNAFWTSIFSFLKKLFIYIGLIYSVVLVTGVQQSESFIHVSDVYNLKYKYLRKLQFTLEYGQLIVLW